MPKRIAVLVLALLTVATTSAFGQDDAMAPIPENIKAHHRALYSSYFDPNLHLKNIDEETRAGRDVDVTLEHSILHALDPEALKEARENPYPGLSLRSCACDADAVVIAAPKSSETGVTTDGGGLFTDYRFAVESVLKNATATHLEGSSIIVTRAGGQATIHGRSVKVSIDNFPLFKIGHRYLLFLGHLSSTDTFEAFDVGSFELTDDGAIPARHEMFSDVHSLKNQSDFLTEVRAAIAASCLHQNPFLGKRQEGL